MVMIDLSDAAGHWTVTFFDNFAASEKREEVSAPERLVELIRTTDADIKARLPWLKLATFGEARTEHGSLRHDANVITVTGVEADYDGDVVEGSGSMTFEQAVEIAEKAGLRCIVYTSPSHTIFNPRWRVVCPFSEALTPGLRSHMMDRLNGLFKGVFAAESWTSEPGIFLRERRPQPRASGRIRRRHDD
jgi:hypothetical protein